MSPVYIGVSACVLLFDSQLVVSILIISSSPLVANISTLFQVGKQFDAILVDTSVPSPL